MTNLKTFIKNNNLSFEKGERNSNSVVLSGFALHNGNTLEDCKNAIPFEYVNTDKKKEKVFKELERVYQFASSRNYGNWWSKDEAKKMYKF